MEEEDIASMVDILNELFSGEWYREITSDFFNEKLIKNPYFSFNETFVAAIEGEIVGFGIHITKGDKTDFLHSLCVKKEYQNKGIGKELLEKIENGAKEKGEKELLISFSAPGYFYYPFGVDSDDKKALDFFLRSGYKINENYYGEGIYYMDIKDFSIPGKILEKERKLEKEGYR